MSNFLCEHCGATIADSTTGYLTECEHYKLEKRKRVGIIGAPSFVDTLLPILTALQKHDAPLDIIVTDKAIEVAEEIWPKPVSLEDIQLMNKPFDDMVHFQNNNRQARRKQIQEQKRLLRKGK